MNLLLRKHPESELDSVTAAPINLISGRYVMYFYQKTFKMLNEVI